VNYGEYLRIICARCLQRIYFIHCQPQLRKMTSISTVYPDSLPQISKFVDKYSNPEFYVRISLSPLATGKASRLTMATTILTEDMFVFKNGDIKTSITLSGKQAVGMVFSHAIALASPVWMKFAFPPPFCNPPNAPTRKNRQVSYHTVSRNSNSTFRPGESEQSTPAS
jgi:hypothetical protein